MRFKKLTQNVFGGKVVVGLRGSRKRCPNDFLGGYPNYFQNRQI